MDFLKYEFPGYMTLYFPADEQFYELLYILRPINGDIYRDIRKRHGYTVRFSVDFSCLL